MTVELPSQLEVDPTLLELSLSRHCARLPRCNPGGRVCTSTLFKVSTEQVPAVPPADTGRCNIETAYGTGHKTLYTPGDIIRVLCTCIFNVGASLWQLYMSVIAGISVAASMWYI